MIMAPMELGMSLDIQQIELLNKLEKLIGDRQLIDDIRHTFRKPFKLRDLLKRLIGRYDWPSDKIISELRSRVENADNEAVEIFDEQVYISKKIRDRFWGRLIDPGRYGG